MVLLLVNVNAPLLFEVGGVSWRVIVVPVYTKSDGKVNGQKVGYNKVTTSEDVIDKAA